jgi:hypothetical protein
MEAEVCLSFFGHVIAKDENTGPKMMHHKFTIKSYLWMDLKNSCKIIQDKGILFGMFTKIRK